MAGVAGIGVSEPGIVEPGRSDADEDDPTSIGVVVDADAAVAAGVLDVADVVVPDGPAAKSEEDAGADVGVAAEGVDGGSWLTTNNPKLLWY